jgi:NADH-quinone oxidoreductase subunit N
MSDVLRAADVAGMLPLAAACFFAMVALLLEVFQRPSMSRSYISTISAVGFVITGLLAWNLTDTGGHSLFSRTAVLDPFALWTTIIFCVGGALTSLGASSWLEDQRLERGEFYALLHFAVAGMIGMVSAQDLVVLFVSLEIMSVSLYALTAYLRTSSQSAEAGLKYFLLGAFASAVLLYGIALLYGATGTTSYVGIAQALEAAPLRDGASWLSEVTDGALVAAAAGRDVGAGSLGLNVGGVEGFAPLATFGMVLVLVAFFTKMAAAPFHFWSPDAYTGAPTPVVGFLSATVKAAWVAALVRLLCTAFFGAEARMGSFGWVELVMVVAAVSIVLGNTVALTQTNLKRMLAFSSVAHAGYLLVGVAAVGFGVGLPTFGGGIVFYLLAYTLATVGAFAVLSVIGKSGDEAGSIEDLNGLAYRSPWLAMTMTVFMLSSAGIPPTAGFLAKFFVLRAAFASASVSAEYGHSPNWMIGLAGLALVASVVGAFFYLRVIAALFMGTAKREVPLAFSPRSNVAITWAAVVTVLLGVFPAAAMLASTDAFLGMHNAGGAPVAPEPVGPPIGVEPAALEEANEEAP